MSAPSAIRVQAQDGRWETLGVDRFSGIHPEKIQTVSDAAGPATMNFQIQRNTGLLHPDLAAFTPVEFEVAGKTVWDGRIKETPTGQGTITVNAEGWRQHLADNALERYYVHQDLTAWQDGRSSLNANLANWASAPTIATAAGSITISWAAGVQIPGGMYSGVFLDLGPSNYAQDLFMDFIVRNAISQVSLYVRSCSQPDGTAGTIVDAVSNMALTTATYTGVGGTFTNGANRYVQIILFNNTGAGFTMSGTDFSVSISRIIVGVNDASLISTMGNQTRTVGSSLGTSDLRASDVIIDKVTRCCSQVSASQGSPRYSDEVLADGPTGYWPFSAGATGVYNDGNTYGYIGDLGNAPANNPITSIYGFPTIPSSISGGLLIDDPDTAFGPLDGSTQMAVVTNYNYYETNYVSLEGIIKPSAINAGGMVCSLRVEGLWGLRSTASGQWQFFAWDQNGTFISYETAVGTMVAGRTYHYIAIYSEFGLFLYVNGVVQAMSLSAGASAATGLPIQGGAIGSSSPVGGGIGGYSVGSGRGQMFQGTLDEIAVYGYALSARQAGNHYRAARAREYGGVQRSQFKIPHYAPAGSQTPQQDMTAVNGVQNWRMQVPVGRKVTFRPQASSPLLKVSGNVDFQNAGANDGSNVYNKVIVEAQDVTGSAVRSTVYASQLPYDPVSGLPNGDLTPVLTSAGVPNLADPSFETSIQGATAYVSTVSPGAPITFSLGTGTAHSGGHSLYITYNADSSHFIQRTSVVVAIPIPGTFLEGVLYEPTVWMSNTGLNYPNFPTNMECFFGTSIFRSGSVATDLRGVVPGTNSSGTVGPDWQGSLVQFSSVNPGSGSGIPGPWRKSVTNVSFAPSGARTFVPGWIPTHTITNGVYFFIQTDANLISGPMQLAVDDIQIVANMPTICERRGFTKSYTLSSQSNLDQASATAVGRAFLLDSLTVPFRGSFVATDPNDVLLLPGETPVHPSELQTHTGELVRVPVVDPNTGDFGRDGKIVNVAYDQDTEAATVTVDDDRNNLQALLARMALLQQAA